MTLYDVVVVGAGPVGVSTAMHAQRHGLRTLVLDKGTVANHLLDFPIGMSFFTPRHSLELLGVPFDSPHQHATREEILSYYNRIARLAELEIHDDRLFERATGSDGDFTVVTRTRAGQSVEYRTRKLVIATGVFGKPRRLPAMPGGDLAKVGYLYRDPFRYVNKDVLLVGVGNSSAGAALALHAVGARVTILDRNAAIPAVKWRWHLQDLQQLIRTGAIRMLHETTLDAVTETTVTVRTRGDVRELPNDHVIALLGYLPDEEMLARVGIASDPITKMPAFNPRTLETSNRGVYLSGIVCAGFSPDKIFVWGARHHPKAVMHHLLERAPLPAIEDRDIATLPHWAQFEKLDDAPDERLVRRLVPTVSGEIRDDFFDVYGHATRSANLYANAEREDLARGASIGPLLDALEGWLLTRNEDGSVIYKGQRLSESAFEILRLCDGTRRLSEIITQLANEYEQPEAELADPVIKLVVSLLRSGKLTWRADPLR